MFEARHRNAFRCYLKAQRAMHEASANYLPNTFFSDSPLHPEDRSPGRTRGPPFFSRSSSRVESRRMARQSACKELSPPMSG